MADLITAGIIMIIIGVAIAYIIREKKRGVKCIGCPAGGSCPHACTGQGSDTCGHCDGKCSKDKG